MNATTKCMKLDLLLLKPYFKSIALVLFVPLVFTIFTGSILEGLSFATMVLAMTTAYTFSVVEKNNLERFYGFIPVKKSNLVFGRYLVVYLIGYMALLCTLGIQVIILSVKGVAVPAAEALVAFLSCAGLFSLYAGVQIPGYYRFGSIKGKMFMFIPTVGFLLFYYVIQMFTNKTGVDMRGINLNILGVSIGVVLVVVVIILISVSVSLRIVKRNDN